MGIDFQETMPIYPPCPWKCQLCNFAKLQNFKLGTVQSSAAKTLAYLLQFMRLSLCHSVRMLVNFVEFLEDIGIHD